MSFDIDSIYVIYAFAAISAVLAAEACYLLFHSSTSYRSRINRRLSLIKDQPDRQNIMVQLRRERGLSSGGGYRLPVEWLNRLIIQSGLSVGIPRLTILVGVAACIVFGADLFVRGNLVEAVLAMLFSGTLLPLFVLKMLRGRRQKQFGSQLPDAIDIIVRSLRAGHPVPVAVSMVSREMRDPIGSEFGLVVDEITYGADLETAMRSLNFRVGQDDLPLFVTAIAIQGSTGGNLGEILNNLSSVIRLRFKMRRKVKALASEGKMSALILSSLPVALFAVVQIASPTFYASVWPYDLTKLGLAGAAAWMTVGNLIMYRMVNFKI
jgi:tight adherence protein B